MYFKAITVIIADNRFVAVRLQAVLWEILILCERLQAVLCEILR